MNDATYSKAFEKMIRAIKAPAEPSPHCTDGADHEFIAISHIDGRETFAWIYECKKCEELVKVEQKRTGSDKLIWS